MHGVFHCFSCGSLVVCEKVGKELFIETTADQLILRTLNDAKSAFAAFYFNESGGFFETFRRDKPSPHRTHISRSIVDVLGNLAPKRAVMTFCGMI